MFVKQIDIKGAETFIIILTVLIFWCVFTVDEIIIYRNWVRVDAVSPKLYGQSVGKGCFA